MNRAIDQFLEFVSLERRRHVKRLCMAAFVAVLIAVLVYETQWLSLRPGLLVLLVGYLGNACALLLRNRQLSNILDRKMTAEAMNAAAYAEWFDGEERFVKRLALFEITCHVLGFLSLGYGFWLSTRVLWLALLFGFFYPVSQSFAKTGAKNRRISEIRAKKREVSLLACSPSPLGGT